jgi:hypothetical protein
VNLKGIVEEDGAIEEFECVYGYPSEECESCETGECELSCSHYVPDGEEAEPVFVKCSVCGKELRQVCSNGEAGDVQCIDCFLKG